MWPLLALLPGLLGFWSDPSADGLKALDEKRYDAAVVSFTAAVAADPKDLAAHFNLAFAFGMLHRDPDAIAEYRKALDLKPDLYEAQLNLGILLIRARQPADAATVLEKAASAKPKEFRPAYFLGEALLAAGNSEASRKAFQTAAVLDPKSAYAELGLARSLARLNHLDDAAPHFRRAAEMDPARRDALLELAVNYGTAGKSDDAIALYSQFPDDPAAQERLGRLLLQANRPADAVAPFKAAVEKSPTAANRMGLVQAWVKTKHPELALPLIEEVLAASPGDFDLVMLKGRVLRDQRKFDLAAAQFQQAAKLRPNEWIAWSELAGVLDLQEDYPGTLDALDHVRSLNAENPGHVFQRARILDKMQRLQRSGKARHAELQAALESYQRFLEISGGKYPDQEFQARQRSRILRLELNGR